MHGGGLGRPRGGGAGRLGGGGGNRRGDGRKRIRGGGNRIRDGRNRIRDRGNRIRDRGDCVRRAHCLLGLRSLRNRNDPHRGYSDEYGCNHTCNHRFPCCDRPAKSKQSRTVILAPIGYKRADHQEDYAYDQHYTHFVKGARGISEDH